MTRLAILAARLAPLDGRTAADILAIARSIRLPEDAPLTVREAADLVMALGATVPPGTENVVGRYASLVPLSIYDEHQPEESPLHGITAPTLGETLERLVRRVPRLWASCAAYVADAWPNADVDQLANLIELGACGVHVRFGGWSAQIEVYGSYDADRVDDAPVASAAYVPDAERVARGKYGRTRPDRRIEVTVGLPTLTMVWQALHAEPLPESSDAGSSGADHPGAEPAQETPNEAA